MPRFVVKQPDGRFAIFSSVVDDFTITDMTLEEAVAETGDAAKVQRGQDDLELESDPPHDWLSDFEIVGEGGLRRWYYCLDTILHIHGWSRLKEVLNSIKD